MCGIGAILDLRFQRLPSLRPALAGINELQAHRGPDGSGTWEHAAGHVGFAHRRLAIIGLERGDQPMTDGEGNWVTYNGEIYNYRELRQSLGERSFTTDSDTEVILRAYRRRGLACLDDLRGMFAFALWDEKAARLVVCRDRFGIKPLYYTVVGDTLVCTSEAKALLPFLPSIETDVDALRDYFAFQFTLAGRTLFDGVRELLPGHLLIADRSGVRAKRWWEIQYEPDTATDEERQLRAVRDLLEDSVEHHLRADVPVGAYLSGGLDSSVVTALASRGQASEFHAFTGRFDDGPRFDESCYARALAEQEGFILHESTIGPDDFVDTIRDVVYHLDYPVAGPGSFPQYIVSREAARHRKVVLGGQGADEVFGGYTRYLVAYFEQCIKAAIEGTMHDGQFVVTYESIIPRLGALKPYRPMIQEFWREGVFGDLDERYFRLVNRSASLEGLIERGALGEASSFEAFLELFRASNVDRGSYFDRMTHFDFKTLLPALLQVEDRVSMAHGLESRTPFLDHPLVEFAGTLTALVKFRGGEMKRALKLAAGDLLPTAILEREDKMGFPVPLAQWASGPLQAFLRETLAQGRDRPYLRGDADLDDLVSSEGGISRGLWGLLSLELWQQAYHDRSAHWRELRERMTAPEADAQRPAIGSAAGR
jgi:asparagine synthase (glutamine-hydrolysing)